MRLAAFGIVTLLGGCSFLLGGDSSDSTDAGTAADAAVDATVISACVDDSECPCDREARECLDPSVVAFVTLTGTDNAACTEVEPCTLTAALEVVTLSAGRDVIHMSEGRYTESLAVDNGVSIRIIGYGATLDSSAAPTVAADGIGTVLSLEGLSIDNNLAGAGHGVVCDTGASLALTSVDIIDLSGTAVRASGACSRLDVRRSRIISNTNGGITVIETAFAIVGNVIAGNGLGAPLGGPIGGVRVEVNAGDAMRFDFNTVVANQSSNPQNQVNCVAGAWVGAGNIVRGGNDPPSCLFEHSNVSNISVIGTNIDAAPSFFDISMRDYRLSDAVQPSAEAIDPGDMVTVPAVDIDGNQRPLGAGAEMGAYEFVAP